MIKCVADVQYLELRLARGPEKLARTDCLLSDADVCARYRQIRDCLKTLLESAAGQCRRQGEADSAARLADAASEVEFPTRAFRLSKDVVADQELARALAALEDSVAAFPEDACRILDGAGAHLARALDLDPGNPFGRLLLAHSHFNRFQLSAAPTNLDLYRDHLKLAYESRRRCGANDPVRLEIEAEYALMCDHDVAGAVEAYQELAKCEAAHGRGHALRAHWMLAGIHLGDWDVAGYAPEKISAEDARNHILEILALWPRSPQAAYFRQQDVVVDEAPTGEDGQTVKVRLGEHQFYAPVNLPSTTSAPRDLRD